MEIKEGMYVRTSKGNISKIKWISSACYSGSEIKSATIHLENDEVIHMLYGEEIKSSYNIIDIIEYGDIVKYKIDDVKFISEVWGEKNNYFVQNFDVPIDLRDLNIVSIVTKEQFESMKYGVSNE